MEEEIDEFEEEVEDLEKEEKSKNIKKKAPSLEKEEVPTERYAAFYQEQRIGIVDTITKEVVVDGLPDVPTANLEAFKLNKLDKIGTVTGVA